MWDRSGIILAESGGNYPSMQQLDFRAGGYRPPLGCCCSQGATSSGRPNGMIAPTHRADDLTEADPEHRIDHKDEQADDVGSLGS